METQGSAVPKLAWRFLLSRQSDGFLSFIAWVSVVGVALGVIALVVVTSVINGFEGELVRSITGMNGDVVLYSRGEPVSQPEVVIAKVKQQVPELVAISPTFVAEMMAGGTRAVSGAVVEGVDPSTSGQVTRLLSRVKEGRFPEAADEVAVGKALAEKIGVKVGDPIRIIAPFAGEAEAGEPPAPKVWPAKVSGIVQMGMHEYDSKSVFTLLPSLQNFVGAGGKVTAFRLKLAPSADSRAVSDRLSDFFGYPFRAKDWGQMNRNLLYAIRLEKVVIAIILGVIVIVAAFNVVSTLMMMIHDKAREIAILKTMGFTPGQSFALFCLVGMAIGAAGTVGGILLGLTLNEVLATTQLIRLPPDIYGIDFLPVVVRWKEILGIGGASLAVTFIATFFPARQVSRQAPLDGIKYG